MRRQVRGLGWFSVGLGVAQLVAPRGVARLIGVRPDRRACTTMRLVGLRELMAGVGLLSRRRPRSWLSSRVLGDAMDLVLLGRSLGGRRGKVSRVSAALVAVAGVTALDVMARARLRDRQTEALAAQPSAGPVRVVTAVTINRTPGEVYAFWRALENLPQFMTNLESVQVLDQSRSRWKGSVGGKTLEWDATITLDRPDELIAWQSVEGSQVDHSGEVRFLRSPGGRGTEVRVEMQVQPPGGPVGAAVGKLLRKVPEQQVKNDLRRLKQVLEVGEVVKSDASIYSGRHPARPPERTS